MDHDANEADPIEELQALRARVAELEAQLELAEAARSTLSHNLYVARQGERRLKHQAHTDPLTGLSTREHFLHRLALAFRVAKANAHPIAVCLADVHGLRGINEAFGNPVGDAVLRDLAQRILSRLRPYDLGARWAGDEFALLFPQTTAGLATIAVERLRKTIEDLPLGGNSVHVGVSFGLVDSSPWDSSPEEVVAAAELALVQARTLKRGQIVTIERH